MVFDFRKDGVPHWKVDSLEKMRLVTHSPGTIIVTDGRFGSNYFKKVASGTENGGTVFVLNNGDVYELQYEGAVNVKWFTNIRDGIIAGMEHNEASYIPAGVYDVTAFSPIKQTTNKLVIFGDGNSVTKFVGSGSEIIFSEVNSNFSCEGIHFDNMRSVIEYSPSTTLTLDINYFNVCNNKFTNMTRPIYFATYSGIQDSIVGKNWTIKNNIIDNCGDGFRLSVNVTEYDISGNKFSNLGYLSGFKDGTGLVGINMGRGTMAVSDVSKNQGLGSIYGNIFSDFVNNDSVASGGATNFLLIEGRNVSIYGNVGRNLKNITADTTDQEGIYCKGVQFTVTDNTLLNAGNDEGSIKFKGEDATMPQHNNIISNNNISWNDPSILRRVGISTTNATVSIVGNRINNASRFAIQVAIQDPGINDTTIIDSNIITDFNFETSGNIISVKDVKVFTVSNNTIQFSSAVDGTMYGIQVESATQSIESCRVLNNTIILDSDTSSVGTIRGVRILQNSFDYDTVDISGNLFQIKNASRYVMLISTSIANIGVFSCNNNINNSNSQTGLTDIVFAPTGTTGVLGYSGNVGFSKI